MPFWRTTRSAIRLAVTLAAISSIVPAQTTSGRLVGRVFDQSSQPLPKVFIKVINQSNGNTRATVTDEQGFYVVPFIAPGLYSITASLDGYTGMGVTDFAVPLNQTTDLRPPDITLKAQTATATPAPSTTGTAGGAGERTSILNTSDPSRRGNFDERFMAFLPFGALTDTRTFDEVALLAPGVAPPPFTPGVKGPGVGFGIGTAGEFSVNGMRARSNNFTVDGSDNNDPNVGVRRQGFVSLVPQSIESINEFEISTLLWDGELGRNVGSQVNVVSKFGGNAYHGQAYGLFTDSRLNARDYFDHIGGASAGKDSNTRTQAGVVFGGPMVRDATQFFVSFERQDINASSEQHFSTPTASERDVRAFMGSILGTTPTFFSVLHPRPTSGKGDLFGSPGVSATPIGMNVLSFYPLPNDPGGPYGANTLTQVLPANGHGSVGSGRLTQVINANNTVNARYNITDDGRTLPSVNRAIDSSIQASTRTQDLSLIVDTALSPVMFNQGRFSYGRTRLDFTPRPGSPFDFHSQSLVPTNQGLIVSSTGPIGELLIQPYSPVGVDVFTFPQARVDNTFQYADSVSRKTGAHFLKWGGDIRRIQLNSLQDLNYRPFVEFADGIANFGNFIQHGPTSPFVFRQTSGPFVLPGADIAAVGIPSSILQTITLGTPNSGIGLRFTEYNFFFNDNWRVSSNFVVDYGLRYEYNSVPHDVNNRIEDALELKALPPASQSSGLRQDLTAFSNTVNAYEQVLGGRKNIYDPYHKEFEPHMGFAWDPWRDGRTSIRAGYGIYYDTVLGAVVSQSRNVFPNQFPLNSGAFFDGINVFALNNPAFIQRNGLHLIAPGTQNEFGGSSGNLADLLGSVLVQTGRGSGVAFTLPEKHLLPPYAQQWQICIERQLTRDMLVSIAYVGTKGTHLTRLATPNLGPELTESIPIALRQGAHNVTIPLPSPEVLADFLQDLLKPRPIPSLGAFQIFEDSASSIYHSLQVGARKTYSHGLTLTAAYTWSHAIDDVSDVFPLAGAPVIAQDQNNFALERGNASFDMRHRLAASVIWALPFFKDVTGARKYLGGWTVSSIFQASSGQPFTLTLPIDANLDGNLTDRPLSTSGLAFISGQGPLRVATVPGATLANFFQLGQDGFVGRNTVSGARFVNLDLGLGKDFRVLENQSIAFRVELFNAFNHPNFGLPIGVISAPAFGSAVDTINPGRIVQFTLRYTF